MEGGAVLSVELSERERRFCEEYIIDYNASRAAVAAGSPAEHGSQRGWELLQRPEVQEYLRFLKSEQSVRTKITADYVLGRIVETLERCNQEVVPYRDRKGNHVEIENKEGEFAKAYVYDAKNVLKAAELLGKHLALFTDVVDNRMTFTQMPDVKVGIGSDAAGQPQEVKALTFDVGGEPNAIKSS